ncbi:MAG: hypothetical protein ACKVU1_12185 [bacterium]
MKRITGSMGALLLMAVVVASGCTSGRAEDESRTAKRTQPAPAAQAPKPRYDTAVIPAGTSIVASLDTRLSTDTNVNGDQFNATTIEPIIVDGKVVIPAGARVRGSLRGVQASGRIKDRAAMTLAFNEIVDSDGKAHSLSSVPLALRADSGTRDDVEKVAAGTVLGAIIGGIADGKDGALKGTAIGAGVGTIVMLATKGDDIELNPGQRLNIQMTAPTSITVLAKK